LFRCVIVLHQIFSLNGSSPQLRARGMTDEILRANATVSAFGRNRDNGPRLAIFFTPPAKGIFPTDRKRSEIGDFNADRTVIGTCRMPGAFVESQRLVNGAVEIQQKMHAQTALIMQHQETSPAGA